jgi:hypothetical protein
MTGAIRAIDGQIGCLTHTLEFSGKTHCPRLGGQVSEKRSKPSSSDLSAKSHSSAAAAAINYLTVYCDERSRSRNKTLGLILINIDVSRSCMVFCILMAYGIYLWTYGGVCRRAEWVGDLVDSHKNRWIMQGEITLKSK